MTGRWAVSTFLLIVAACSRNSVNTSSVTYTPSEVVAQAKSLQGRTIRVRGYLFLSDEAHGLWNSAGDLETIKMRDPDPDDPIWSHCITAYYSDRGAQAIGRDHPRNLIAIGRVGIERSKNSLDLGACSNVFIRIEDVASEESVWSR